MKRITYLIAPLICCAALAANGQPAIRQHTGPLKLVLTNAPVQVIDGPAVTQPFSGDTTLWDDLPRQPIMMWRAARPGKEAFILGSLHMGPDDLFPLPDEIISAFEDCEATVFEVDPRDLNREFQARLSEAGTLPAGSTLSSLLDPAIHKRLRESLKEIHMPEDALEEQEPWMAALILTLSYTVNHRGLLSAENGIDRHFMELARESRKTILGLEAADDQLALFQSLDRRTGIEFLEKALDELDEIDVIVSGLVEAWKGGDADAIWRITQDSFDRYPGVYKSWVTDRNAAWAERLDVILDKHPHTFVVVGAAHVAGPDSLITLLSRRGYVVEQAVTIPHAVAP